MTEERLERVARQFRTNEGATKALRITAEDLVKRCGEKGIEPPAVWHRRLKQVFKEMAATRA